MKTKIIMSTIVLLAAVALLSGCGTPQPTTAWNKDQILQQPDVKNKPPTIYAKPLAEVRTAGLRALTQVGCEIKVQDPLYLSGRRPNKIGLFVGSGGETVKIFLYPQSEMETHVWVDTDLSFVGIAGQQSWEKQTFEILNSLLGQPVQGGAK